MVNSNKDPQSFFEQQKNVGGSTAGNRAGGCKFDLQTSKRASIVPGLDPNGVWFESLLACSFLIENQTVHNLKLKSLSF